MKRIILALALLLVPAAASAQCNGVFPNNTLCGNVSGAGNLPRPVANNVLTGVPGGTNGQIEYNNNGVFGGFTASGDATIVPSTGVVTIQPGVVNSSKIATNGVATANITAGAVTNSKLSVGTTGTAKGTTDGVSMIDGLVSTLLNAACTVTPSTCYTFAGYYNITWYGAVCDGSTNDTTAIAAAIAAAQSTTFGGATVLIPSSANGCVVNSGFNITKSIKIIGAGPFAKIKGTLSAGTNLFNVVATTNGIQPLVFDGLILVITGGNNLFYFDTVTNTGSFISELTVSNILALPSQSLTGAPVRINGNASGQTFDATFLNNQLYANGTGNFSAGYALAGAGDSIRIIGGEVSGPGYGVYLTQVSGAGNFVMSNGTNITACGGLFIATSIAPIIRDFEMEAASGCASLTNAFILITGALGGVDNAVLGPGQLQILPGATGYGTGITVTGGGTTVTQTSIAQLRVAGQTGGTVGIAVGASANNTVFGPRVSVSGFSTSYTDAGTSTVHVVTAAGPS